MMITDLLGSLSLILVIVVSNNLELKVDIKYIYKIKHNNILFDAYSGTSEIMDTLGAGPLSFVEKLSSSIRFLLAIILRLFQN